jgi:hypothetical protein
VSDQVEGEAELLDDVELWNREDASELDPPSDLKQYDISIAARDWTVQTIVQQVKQGNIDLDPAPFTEWITACGLDSATFTTLSRELGRPVSVDEVRPVAAAALADVFTLTFDEIPADDGPGLWNQPVHDRIAAGSR